MIATKIIRKIIVAVVGVPILGLGIFFIPVPGPGLLLCLLGLFILASEFEVAKPYRDKAQKQLRTLINKAKEKQKAIDEKYK